MRIAPLLLAAALLTQLPALAQKATIVNPNDVQLSPHRHKELSPALLKRIRATTDVFEMVDGLSYESAVDLYKRDISPEENLVLWEEMARAYTTFCKARCSTAPERMDVYRALLLRSMFEEGDAIRRAQPKVLSAAEVGAVVRLYRLPAKPIEVVKGK
jgi:hypothetical protein